LHEWRGNGSSSLRPSRHCDWGYRQILQEDLPAAHRRLLGWMADVPLLIGGHSLGGQLACCYAGLHPTAFERIWLVASGTPWWRSFPAPRRYALPAAYRFLPWLARRHGTLPGRRIGFGGTEARGLITDWARVGLTDRYAAAGLPQDLEAAMRALDLPVEAVLFEDDWLAPPGSLKALTSRMRGPTGMHILPARSLGTRADHFSWMKQPAAVAASLCGSPP
ncbi:MAG TPA: alpha/beta fold hydrolase, partial [Bordetella sp.]|nr:alpha/beta fold hydrolase [Bordetella sp.]